MARRRLVRWVLWCGLPLAGLLAVVLSVPFWLRPSIENWASAKLARPVTIGHLHLASGAPLVISAEDVIIGNPQNFPSGGEPFARVSLLTLRIDVAASLRHRKAVIASVELQQPVVRAVQTEDGQENYRLDGFAAPRDSLNALKIVEGRAHVSLASLHADFEAAVAAEQTTDTKSMTKITTEATGTYAGQPVVAQFVGEMPRALDISSQQWPVELDVQNGPTRLSAKGTVKDLLSLRGTLVDILVRGPDMALLRPLTGVPFPATPPYELRGELDNLGEVYRLTNAVGRLGHSDIAGSVTAAKGSAARPEITAELHSHSLVLADIESLLGGQPGSPGTPGQTPQQHAQALQREAEARADPRVLPHTPLRLPTLELADVHLVYRGDRIQGASMPVDDMTLHMDVVGGTVTLHPLSFGVGGGRISSDVWLTPQEDRLRARAEMQFARLDVSHLMRATRGFQGRGELNGTARVEGTGRSVAEILGHADGTASLSMSGGDLSKLLVDLVGLRLGSALISSLGRPSNTQVECFVADLALRRGLLSTRTLLLKTEDTVTQGDGVIDLGREQVELQLRTASRHLTVGVLPAPLVVSGTFKDPHAAPVMPGGLAGALASLPTLQTGIGDGPHCAAPSSAIGR